MAEKPENNEFDADYINRLLLGFQDRTGGPSQILIHTDWQGNYTLRYVNLHAERDFGLRRVGVTDEPLAWEELPEQLAAYLHQIFSTNLQDEDPTLPIFEMVTPEGTRYFSGSLCSEIEERTAGSHYWSFFVFNEVTSWIGLQEEVMNARRLESIGGLASGVAHDFNNLILAIQGYSEYLLMTKDHDAETKKALQQIMNACSNGTSLTRSLLGYARRQSLSMSALNISDLVNDVVDLCRRSYGPRFELKLDELFLRPSSQTRLEPGTQIYGCYSALSHSLLNILNNARDAMKEGGIIEIRHAYEDDQVHISVRDEGSGIDPESFNKIFDPFFTTKEKGAGTGLGLSMVQGIMQQHGGEIRVASKVDQGTEVTLIWPFYSEVEEGSKALQETTKIPTDATKISKTEKRKTGRKPPLRPGEIPSKAYLIEDDPIVQGSVSSLLKIQNIQVVVFSSAQEALDRLTRGDEVSLIFCDYTMPGMDGKEFIQKAYQFLKTTPKPFNTRIILMSGYPPEHFDDFVKKFKDFQIHLLQKPFSSQTLKSIIAIRQRRFLRKITTRVQIHPKDSTKLSKS